MNRTTATCIAGMRSKTTSKTRIHFFPRPREAKPFTRFTRRFLAFGVGILAKRLRWRPSATRHDGEQLDARDRSRVAENGGNLSATRFLCTNRNTHCKVWQKLAYGPRRIESMANFDFTLQPIGTLLSAGRLRVPRNQRDYFWEV